MSEELIELEVTLRRTEWDHEGRMTKTVEIAADNPEYSLLLSRRSFCVNDAQEDEAEGLRFWL